MNRIYKILWSVSTQSWQAVPENARTGGKKSTASAAGVVASVALGFALSGAAHAQSPPAINQLPTGGTVARGTATLSQTATAQAAAMTVNQSSQRAVINWDTFNLGSKASVNFVQPNAQAVTLNRVNDSNPSQIFGRITANGQVFLTNANGVYFSPTSSVDVGALTATTHTISDDNFMSGKYVFERNGSTGKVINDGNINAALGGYVALLAPEVQNAGVVVAKAGTVAMAAGEMITLTVDNNGSLAGITTTPSTIATLVENKHAVLAPDGQIILSAVALDKLQVGVIKNSGSLEANSISHKGGKIYLEGDDITLTSTSKIEAKGATGGGTVLVGGDWQGSGDLRQATKVTMEAGATIDASATDNGDGGKVVLWSDVHNANSQTNVAGRIQAEGQGEGTRGGQIETSGAHLHVADSASIRMGGLGTTGGRWLLDPNDFTIAWSGGDTTGALLSASITANTTVEVLNGSGASGTNGNINVNDSLSWSNNGVLKLSANGVVTGTGNIAMTGGGKVIFNQAGDTVNTLNSSTNSYFGTISGTGGFAKDGTGRFSFMRNQTYTGDTLISAGTLQMNIGSSAATSGNISTSSAVTNNATLSFYNTPTGASNFSYAFGASVGGTGNLVVQTNSFATLTGANSYAGTTTVNTGALLSLGVVNAGSLNGSFGTGDVINNGSIQLARIVDLNVTNNISGSGSITAVGGNTYSSGTFTLSGNNTFTGQLILQYGGIIVLGSSNAAGAGTGISFIGDSTLRYSAVNTVDYSNRIAISPHSRMNIDTNGQNVTWASALPIGTTNSMTKIGAGTLQINRAISFPGGSTLLTSPIGVTVKGGTLVLGGANTIGNGITIDAGATLQVGNAGTTGDLGGTTTVTNNGTLTFNRSNAISISNVINGTGALVQAGSGTTTLQGANGYTGGTTLSAGALSLGSASALGPSGAISFEGGALQLSASNSTDYSSRFSTAANQAYNLDTNGQSLTLGTALNSVGGTLTKSGSGTLSLSLANGYTGTTTVNGGTLAVTNANALGTTAAGTTVASGATLDLRGVTVGSEAITLNGGTLATSTGTSSLSGDVTLGANATANVGGTSLTLTGVVSGGFGLTKSGSGTLVLAAANTYSTTTLSAGTLRLANDTALGGNSITVPAGATLELGAIDGSNLNVTGKTITLASSGTFGGGGYLHNVAGANIWSDAITLQNNSTIAVDTGTSLNLSSTSSTVAAAAKTILKPSDGNLTFGTLTGSGGAGYLKTGEGTLAGNFVGLNGQTMVYARPVDASNLNSSNYGSAPGYSLGFFSASTGGTQFNLVSGTDYTGTIAYGGAPTATSVPGMYNISYTSGATISNAAYYLVGAGTNLTWTVTPKPLTITVGSSNKTYDGLAFSGGSVTYGAFANGQTAADLTGTLTYGGTAQGAVNASATPYTITASGLSSPNYAISYVDGSLTIGKANLSKVTTTKVYDGLSTVTAAQMTAIQGVHGESFGASGGTATISDKNVAGTKTITDLSNLILVGTGAASQISNYNVGPGSLPASGSNNVVTITAKALTVTAPVVSKEYDGTTNATGAATLSALGAGDVVNAAALLVFTDKNVGAANKTVHASGLTIKDASNADMTGNYVITYTDNTASTITRKALTVSGTSIANKTYDGTNVASLSGGSLVGVISGDNVTLTQAGTFVSANAGTGVSVTAADTLGGTGAGNYMLTQPTGLTANIGKAPLTVTAADAEKNFGSANPAFSVTVSGYIAGETAATSGVTGTGLATTTATDLTVAGTAPITASVGTLAATNYAFTRFVDGTLTIKPIAAMNNTEVSTLIGYQLSKLTGAQVASFSATQLQVFSPQQLSSLSPSQLAAMTTAQVLALSPVQVAAIGPAKIASLSAPELGAFSNEQLQALSVSQIAAISPDHFAALKPEQIMALSISQVINLTPDQLRGFSPAQVASLSAAEIAYFDARQLAAIGIVPKDDVPPAIATSNQLPLNFEAPSDSQNKFQAAIPVMTDVARANAPATPTTTATQPVAPVAPVVAVAPKTGVLAITILSNAEARPTTAGVAFEQDASGVKLRITSAPPTTPTATGQLAFNDKLTTFMVSAANGDVVEFQGSLVNKRLVIVAPNAAAKQVARAEMNVVLAAAITSLGAESRVMLANLDGVVLDLR